MNIHLKNMAKVLAGSVVLSSAVTLNADDTEMFFSSNIVNPNVMFVLDVSGSMDTNIPGTGKTRLEAMQSALGVVLDNAPDTLNVGLMNYGEIRYSDYVLGVKFPVSDIDSPAFPIVSEALPVDDDGDIEWKYSNTHEPDEGTTVREYLPEMTTWYWKDNFLREPHRVRNATRRGTTPIVDALFEAALYFRGDTVGWGHRPSYYTGTGLGASHPSTYEGPRIEYNDAVCSTGTKYDYMYGRRLRATDKTWWRCPDANGDLSILGTYANCTIRGQGVDKSYTYNRCRRWTPYRCLRYSQRDEEGNRRCLQSAPRRCVGGYERKTVKRYRYKRCKGGYPPKPSYKSPIKNTCQSSFIVLLSDGKPQYSNSYDNIGNRDGTNRRGRTYDYLRRGSFDALEDKTDSTKTFDHTNCANNLKPSGFASGACGPELTRFLADNDQGAEDGKQTVDTFAIGFGLGDANAPAAQYLKSLVTTTVKNADGIEVPAYFSAENEEQLASVFDNLLTKIGASTTALASPGYSVNVKSSLAHNDDIYIPIFNKRLQPRWSGNLKKFKLAYKKNADETTSRKIVGKNDAVATSELGVFAEDAWDFWSTSGTADGREVEKGGVAALLDSSKRNLFTNINCIRNCDLSNKAFSLQEGNRSITPAHLGIDIAVNKAAHRTRQLRFIGGQRWDSAEGKYVERRHMGDMMHSKPVVVDYTTDGKRKIEQVVFAATNEGYLHAFDADTGKELYAFMPAELLKNIDKQFKNSELGTHIYGIDGGISIWNKRGKKGEIEKRMLYFGLRRGGRSYYALDITDKLKPKLAWMVSPSSHKGFEELGQSWSNPYLTRMQTDDGLRPFMIFSGGYDENQDLYADKDKNPLKNPENGGRGRMVRMQKKSEDTMGHDIFIVDAEKGPSELTWSIKGGRSSISGKDDLQHSIPGGVRMVDMNRDGATDRMYFADTGGNIWRLDMPTGFKGKGSLAKGSINMTLTHLADFSGNEEESRKFYTEPDVALMKHGGKPYLTISIGSGWRSHPLDKTVEDRFYVLKDEYVYKAPEDERNITNDSHLVGTSMTIADGVGTLSKGILAGKNILDISNKRGWYLGLPSDGEKVLATSLTRDGNILFTTLAPDVSEDEGIVLEDESQCGAPPSQGRFYTINALTAEKMKTYDAKGNLVSRGYIETISDNEIPGSPQLIFGEPSCSEAAQKCEHTIGARINKKASEVLKLDTSYVEPVYWSDPVSK